MAGEISKRSHDDVSTALSAYETVIRPLIDECQQLNPGGPRIFCPASGFRVLVLQSLARTMSVLQVDRLISWWMGVGAKSGWVATEYPELHLDD